jgi:hypothetical protein
VLWEHEVAGSSPVTPIPNFYQSNFISIKGASIMSTTIGRNDPCHCGSGKKYKKCHLEADEKTNRKEREKAALNAAKVAAEAEKDQEKNKGANPAKKVEHGKQGFMGKVANKVGFFRGLTQRRTGPSSKAG